jgi:hypothetical protein
MDKLSASFYHQYSRDTFVLDVLPYTLKLIIPKIRPVTQHQFNGRRKGNGGKLFFSLLTLTLLTDGERKEIVRVAKLLLSLQ